MQTQPQVRRSWKLPLTVFFATLIVAALTVNLWPEERGARKPAAEPPPQLYVAIAKGRVDVAGGLVRLAARRDGVVKEVFVEEGDVVKKGQVLATLIDDAARLAELVVQREVAQAQAAITVIQVRRHAAQREVDRFESVLPDAAVARIEYDQARDQLALAHAERKAAEANLVTSQSRLKQSAYERERSIIRAPMDGEIVRRTARPGDGVSSLNVTPLFVFAPNTPRIVRAELEERFVGEVAQGSAAEIVAEADESRVFTAKIVRVGRVFGLQQTVGDDPAQRQDVRVIEVVLSLEQNNLLIGQRVLVKFKRPAA